VTKLFISERENPSRQQRQYVYYNALTGILAKFVYSWFIYHVLLLQLDTIDEELPYFIYPNYSYQVHFARNTTSN